MDETNILLTSIGRRVELVRAFKDAYSSTGISGHIVATDVDPLAPAMLEVDVPIIVPRFTDTAFIPKLVNICEEHSISAVFPLIDPDIPLLAAHRAAIEATGAKLAVVKSEAASVCGDKFLTNEFFEKIGLACPQAWRPEDLPPSLQYPLFIKPRDGSAAEHTYKVNNDRELDFFKSYVSNPIIQEFLPGPEISSDVVCDLNGRVISIVSRQRIAVRGGEVVKGVTVYDERIVDACELIAKRLPAIGPITAQCMMKDGIPHFIEINARLGGGIPLAIAAGVDVPEILLLSVAGQRVQPLEPGAYTHGLHMTRFDDSFFTSEDSIVEPQSHRI